MFDKMGRKHRCVIKTSPTASKKVMSHGEFMKRITKSLYFGNDFIDDQDVPNSLEMSKPLAEYASELFSDSHRGYTLNRLSTCEASIIPTATPATLIMALIYLDRLNITDPGYVRRITPQELFIVSMMISTKFYAGYDEEIYVSDWADYGNMAEDYLKQLELKFLCAIEWNIYISNEQFFEKLTCVEKTLAQRQGLRRGWLTYSELVQMLPSFTLAKFLLSNITVIAVSYAASAITIAGAFFLALHTPGTSLHRQRTQLATNTTPTLNNAKVNVTSPVSPYSVVVTQELDGNHSGLNVEDELLKLVQKYREEALPERLFQNNNEISTESRLTLPKQMLMAKLNVNQKCAKHGKQYQQQGQWFANKEELSEYWKWFEDKKQESCRVIPAQEKYNSIDLHGNSTSIVHLWHFLADTVHHVNCMRHPFVWLKFM